MKKINQILLLTSILLIASCSDDDDAMNTTTVVPTTSVTAPSQLELLKGEAEVALLFNGDAEDEESNLTFSSVEGAILTNDRKGMANSAYFFDGVDDYIEYSGMEAITDPDTFTISVWAKNDAFPDDAEYQFIYSAELLHQLGLGKNDDNGIYTRSLTYALDNTDPDWFSKFADLNETDSTFNSVWQHYILQYNNGVIKVYLNGIEKDNYNGSGEVMSSLNLSTIIGAKSNASNGTISNYFKGAIDDFMLFNKALTVNEIMLLANDN